MAETLAGDRGTPGVHGEKIRTNFASRRVKRMLADAYIYI